jgi:hypothetical protein
MQASESMSLHFMTRVGRRNPTVPTSEWVYVEEGPKTWNLEEIYTIKRITEVLTDAGTVRADARMNFISGLLRVISGTDCAYLQHIRQFLYVC